MIKKSIFVILAMFGFSSVADMHTESNHMSDMMDSSSSMGEESGFNGAVEMKAHILKDMSFSYRARMGWMGDVNEQFQWGVAVSSAVDGNQFGGIEGKGLAGIALEQAYVSYKPMDGWSIMAGKHHWKTKFNKTGVLYDDDLYVGGVNIKYRHGEAAHPSAYFKAGLNTLGNHKGPHANGNLLNVKVGGNYAISDGVMLGVYASAQYDGLFPEAEATSDAAAIKAVAEAVADEAVADEAVAEATTAKAKTLAQFGVNVMTSNMAVPVGAFGVYVTDTANFSDSHSWNAGVYVGKASTPQKDDANDFGVSVSYYDINAADHNTALVDTDYMSGAGKGIAVRAQYNLMDSVNVVAKYNRNLDDEANNLIGELTFNF